LTIAEPRDTAEAKPRGLRPGRGRRSAAQTNMATKKKNPPASTREAPAERKPLLAALLRLSHESVTEQISESLSELGFDDLPAGYFTVVQPLWVEPQGLRIADLVAQANGAEQAVNALVARLEEHGYVERVDDPAARRTQLLRLSERGGALVNTTRLIVEAVETRWAERLGEARIEALRETLTAIVTEDWG
jgi:DNA-binding MarR family transcriptional regulator